jgi:pimeloyl-ACP methyl ester carboxylesterase
MLRFDFRLRHRPSAFLKQSLSRPKPCPPYTLRQCSDTWVGEREVRKVAGMMASMGQAAKSELVIVAGATVSPIRQRCVLAARFVIGLVVGLLAGILAGEPARAAGSSARGSDATSQKYMIDVAPAGLPPARLYAEELGSGPTVVLLHGLGGSGYTWRYMVDALSRHHRIIAIDLKGFGRSSKPFDQSYAAPDQAAYVRAFLEQRGLRGITLVGHSFGGAVAMALILDLNRSHQDRVSRLVLLDTPALPQTLSPTVQLLQQPILPKLALTLLPPAVVAKLSLLNDDGAFAHLTPNDLSVYAAPLADPGAAHALVTTAQRIVPENFEALIRRYPSIHQPTLLLWCRNDTIVPVSTGLRLARMLPRARLRLIERCGHTPAEENPGATTAHLLRFLHQK